LRDPTALHSRWCAEFRRCQSRRPRGPFSRARESAHRNDPNRSSGSALVAAGNRAMLDTRLNSIPRFALPYTAADFRAGLMAVFAAPPPPEEFGFLGGSPKFWTGSGRQALRLLLTSLDLAPGSGVALPLFADPSLAAAIVAAGHKPV